MAEYMTFEEVLEALEIDATELKRMINAGEIRAFRDGNAVKFKREDVAGLRQGRESEPTLILPSDEVAAGGDDEVVDFGETVDEPMEDDLATVPTIELSDDSQHVTEEIEFDSEMGAAASEDDTVVTEMIDADATVMEGKDEEDIGAVTEVLKFADEDDAGVTQVAEDDGGGSTTAADESAAAGGRPRTRRLRGVSRMQAAYDEQQKVPIVAMIFLILTFITSIYLGFFMWEHVRYSDQTDLSLTIEKEGSYKEVVRNKVEIPKAPNFTMGFATWADETWGGKGMTKQPSVPDAQHVESWDKYTVKEANTGEHEGPVHSDDGGGDDGSSDDGSEDDGSADGG